jgi:4-oxalocrotonate tautomerase
MPHIIVKMWPGKSEEQKQRLADEIVKDFVELFGYKDESLSVAIEEIPQQEWAEKVYKPEIAKRPETLYKKPGYKM